MTRWLDLLPRTFVEQGDNGFSNGYVVKFKPGTIAAFLFCGDFEIKPTTTG